MSVRRNASWEVVHLSGQQPYAESYQKIVPWKSFLRTPSRSDPEMSSLRALLRATDGVCKTDFGRYNHPFLKRGFDCPANMQAADEDSRKHYRPYVIDCWTRMQGDNGVAHFYVADRHQHGIRLRTENDEDSSHSFHWWIRNSRVNLKVARFVKDQDDRKNPPWRTQELDLARENKGRLSGDRAWHKRRRHSVQCCGDCGVFTLVLEVQSLPEQEEEFDSEWRIQLESNKDNWTDADKS